MSDTTHENVAPTPPENITNQVEAVQDIVIDFTKSSEDGKYSFSDAIHIPANHTFTEEEIESMKQERFDNWLSFILAEVK